MINCLLIKISHNARGVLARSYRTLTAEEITIGRGAECTIHLPDPRLAMHHAVIKRLDGGQIHLVAVNGELAVDGSVLQNIELTHGKLVTIGPYQLKVEPAPPDVNLTISLLLVQRLPDDFQDLKSRTHEPLRGASSFKRRASLWMAAFIALIFLALPLAQNLAPPLQKAMAQLPFGFDRVWSPGHISNSHLHFGAQCFNCHEVLTRKVSNKACVNCHRDTAPHIANPALQKSVFTSTHLFSDGVRCAECHREHKAPYPLTRQDNGTCVKCHGDIKSISPTTLLPNVKDFDRDHPDFKLTFKTGRTKDGTGGDIERIPQAETARLIEKSGLKFPHSQHVGLVQGPNGIWDVRELSCTNCHQQEGKEMRFKPVSYQRDCLLCHTKQLQVGPAKAVITVPHGSEQNVISALQVQAPKKFKQYSASLKSDGCAYCHEIPTQESALSWRVMPLNINQDWFSKARFNHASHRTQQCKSCHQVEKSETSADVAMPDRKSCLRCHSGNSPKSKRIASGCMSCHEFHGAHLAQPLLLENKNLDAAHATAMPASPHQ
ncbi:MAG: FHA domain-containing protein [Methylotenera sp.]|nr:FHA domain-containing protein [Methylotenera sp.]MSP99048.1 FHA domain-containing protein [Methylotenera sp.]